MLELCFQLAFADKTLYKINLAKIFINKKSNIPKKAATPIEIPITIKVYLKVCCLLGQSTFLASTQTSLKKVLIFGNIILKNPTRGALFYISPLFLNVKIPYFLGVRLDKFLSWQYFLAH